MRLQFLEAQLTWDISYETVFFRHP
jgi:hypothetical protein